MGNQDPIGSNRKHSTVRTAFAGAILLFAATAAACTTGDVFALQPAVDVGSTTAGIAPPAAIPQTLAPPSPVLAAYPRFEQPVQQFNVMPADEVACRQELRRLNVKFRDVPTVGNGSSCGIDYPVEVTSIGNVGMKPAATLTCAMAATFAGWTRRELVPAARMRYLSGVRTIHQGSSYSCRNIAGTGGVLSEHGKGNALDIMSIELNNGKNIDVRKPGLFAFRERSLLNTVRADGCQYFTTVLGPGYNKDHADHFHFDIKNRRNGYVACK